MKYEQLQKKLKSLNPNSRKKIGLINGLGTVIKSIIGNMDADDAINLNKEIESLTQKENSIEEHENNQIRLKNQMIERFNKITNHINYQQKIFENYLNKTGRLPGNRIRSEESSIRCIQYLNQINFNIELLDNHLSNIAESIILAKLNIISKHILDTEELDFINESFKNESIEIKSNEHMYELLKLQAYYQT